MATTNCPSTNTSASFAAQVTWSFSPSTPSVSMSTTSGDGTITASASASTSTGTFSVSSVYGSRTGTNAYSASHTMIVSFSVSNISWSRTGCDVYFNTSSGSAWSNMSWSGTAATTSSTTLQLTTSNTTVSSMNNRVFRGTVNLGYSTTTQYSLDNSTWQSSGNFTGLTPNQTYTVYARSYATSASGNSSGYGYTNRTVTLGAKPGNLTITLVSKSITSLSVSFSADNTPTNYTAYYKKSSDSSYTSVNLGTTTTLTLNDLMPETNYDFYFIATNGVGSTTSTVSTFGTDPELPTGIYLKESNVWEIGQPYYKINGVWVKAGGIFYNETGTWQQAKL